MTPEASRFLAKARKLLEHATTMLGVGLNEDAGRTAYLAGFHAAQAFIFETTQMLFKSHKGVQTEFLRLTKGDPRFTPGQRIFLSQTYNFKAIADYETGPGSEISAERAERAVAAGKQFVEHIARLVSLPDAA
ncbi:MAG: HEPN domain-containing protein [Methylocella sp.]